MALIRFHPGQAPIRFRSNLPWQRDGPVGMRLIMPDEIFDISEQRTGLRVRLV